LNDFRINLLLPSEKLFIFRNKVSKDFYRNGVMKKIYKFKLIFKGIIFLFCLNQSKHIKQKAKKVVNENVICKWNI